MSVNCFPFHAFNISVAAIPPPFFLCECSIDAQVIFLTLAHLLSTLIAAYSKLRLSVMRGSDSGKQWSGQVITGQANRGPMKHENLPSPKLDSNTHTWRYTVRLEAHITERRTKTRTNTSNTHAFIALFHGKICRSSK